MDPAVAARTEDRAPLALEVGSKLGRLEILEHLADGGMARVWLATLRDVRGAARCVVKTVLPSLEAPVRAEFEALLVKEAALARHVRHPNVAKTLGIGEHGGHPYIIQSLVTGTSLDDALRALETASLRLPVGWVVQLAIGIARGLHGIHTAAGRDGIGLGLVHRDINPSNVVLSFDGSPCIIDFGVVKSLRLDPAPSVLFKGTMRYAPPEQLRGEVIDARADLHALGVLMHDALDGSRAHDHAAFLDLAKRTGSFPAISELPSELDRLLGALTSGKPEKRPATALQVAHALEKIAREVPVPGPEALGELAHQTRGGRPGPGLDRLGLSSAPTRRTGTRPVLRDDLPTREQLLPKQRPSTAPAELLGEPTRTAPAPEDSKATLPRASVPQSEPTLVALEPVRGGAFEAAARSSAAPAPAEPADARISDVQRAVEAEGTSEPTVPVVQPEAAASAETPEPGPIAASPGVADAHTADAHTADAHAAHTNAGGTADFAPVGDELWPELDTQTTPIPESPTVLFRDVGQDPTLGASVPEESTTGAEVVRDGEPHRTTPSTAPLSAGPMLAPTSELRIPHTRVRATPQATGPFSAFVPAGAVPPANAHAAVVPPANAPAAALFRANAAPDAASFGLAPPASAPPPPVEVVQRPSLEPRARILPLLYPYRLVLAAWLGATSLLVGTYVHHEIAASWTVSSALLLLWALDTRSARSRRDADSR